MPKTDLRGLTILSQYRAALQRRLPTPAFLGLRRGSPEGAVRHTLLGDSNPELRFAASIPTMPHWRSNERKNESTIGERNTEDTVGPGGL